MGTSELLSGTRSKCLWINDAQLEFANSIPAVRKKIDMVRAYRETGGEVAKTLVRRSHQFRFRNTAKVMQIVVPQVCTVDNYLPVDLTGPHVVVTHLAHVMFDAGLHNFSLISSRIHFIWATTLSGRHGNGLRYGSNLCWNTFPVPPLTEKNKADLTRCAEDILLAREAHFPATIAEMYDPNRMDRDFPDLRAAHERNDEVLERIYIGRRFRNDTERLEKLFELYTKLTAGAAAGKKQKAMANE